MSSEVGMNGLTDDELIEAYALNCDCEGTRVMLNGIRAVADAAVAGHMPDVLFDSYAVFKRAEATCPSLQAHQVGHVLDAVVALICEAHKKEPTK